MKKICTLYFFIACLICSQSKVYSDIRMSDYRDYLENNASVVWDKYPTYGEYVGFMEKFEEDYPDLAELHDLGPAGVDSLNHRIYALKISDNVFQDEQEPAFMFTSMLHGDETLSYVLLLHLIDSLLAGYSNPRIKNIVDNVELWICPLLNPDGTYPKGDYTVANARRYNIADMFDLNRNFPCPCGQPGHEEHGMYPHTAAETKAVRELIESKNFIMSAGLHSSMEIAIYPWCFCRSPHPDSVWFIFITKEYADTAQAYSPTGYFVPPMGGPGYVCCSNPLWYETHGSLVDYMNYHQRCRGIVLYLSSRKLVPETDLPDYWEWNYRPLLNYIEQVLYGVRGTVRDSLSGAPLEAKVFVEGHDSDTSLVYSHLPHGDFYRPLQEGVFNVTFSAEGYYPKTITGVQAKNYEVTALDVKLKKIPTNAVYLDNEKSYFSVNACKGVVKIVYDTGKNSDLTISIFDVFGKLVKRLHVGKSVGNCTITWNGVDNNGIKVSNGCYVIQVKAGGRSYSKHFMFSR